ncbi:MAG: metallophosphoesterase [Opitutaceae bacterium]|jgi:hypothetical protein
MKEIRNIQTHLTRRQALGRLATLLAAGCWPGCLYAEASSDIGEFSFVAANDFHHASPECDVWFERLFRQIATHPRLAFCIGLGDLADKGLPESIAAIRRISVQARTPFYSVPGNHDKDVEATTRIYAEIFPGRLNYAWTHEGWQFVAIDSTDGKAWKETRIQPKTLDWLDATLPALDRTRPTVLFTHFPLAHEVFMCPLNAEDVLARFVNFNLRGVFTGHFHGQTSVMHGGVALVTNACCSRVQKNHDGTTRKGYWLCQTLKTGTISRSFVEFTG